MSIEQLVFFNAWGSVFIALACGWAILSRQVDDGFIMRVGLAMVSLGHVGSASLLIDGAIDSDTLGLLRAQAFVRIGCVIIGAGYLLRHTEAGKRLSASCWRLVASLIPGRRDPRR